MKQRLTTHGTIEEWTSHSIQALEQAGFTNIKFDELFNRISAKSMDNPFEIEFVESKDKIMLNIIGSQEGINAYKASISSIFKGEEAQRVFFPPEPPKPVYVSPKPKWYKTTWFTVVTLIIFFPVGLALMWINKKWHLVSRIIITAFFAIILVIGWMNPQKTQPISPSSPTPELYSIGSNAPESNTTSMVDYIIHQARDYSKTCNKTDSEFAFNWIVSNKDNLFSDNETMERAIYYGALLEYYNHKNKPAINTKEYYLGNIGQDVAQAAKNVYRGVETVDSTYIQENLFQIEDTLSKYNEK